MKISLLRNYDLFHKNSVKAKRIINSSNFTYYNVLRLIEKGIGGKRKLRILDYGCGVGSLSMFLADKGFDVTGVDVSRKAIDVAKSNLDLLKDSRRLMYFTNDEFLKRSNQRFDLILCIEVIEHVKSDKELIRFFNSMLNQNGKLLLTTPSNEALLYRLGLLNEFDLKVGHLRRYDKSTLVKLVSGSFKITELYFAESFIRNILYTNELCGKLIRFIRGPLSPIVMKLDNLLVKLSGGSNLYLIAQKI